MWHVDLLYQAFECPNPSDTWLPSFPSPKCNDLTGSYYSMAGINIATDLLVLILPIKPALGLQVNRRRKCKYKNHKFLHQS